MTPEYFLGGLATVLVAMLMLSCVVRVVKLCQRTPRSSLPVGQQEMELGNASSSPSPQRTHAVGGFQNTYYSPSTSVGYSGITYDDLSEDYDDDTNNPFHLGSR